MISDPHDLDPGRLSLKASNAILEAFSAYQSEFMSITRRAKSRFENRDWHGAQQDSVERLDLYKKVIQQIVAGVGELLKDQTQNRAIWSQMKAEYSLMIGEQNDFELAETFFNSVTRRIFVTVGVDPKIEFVDSDFEAPPPQTEAHIFRTYFPQETGGFESTQTLLEAILADYPFCMDYQDMRRDATLAAMEIQKHLHKQWGTAQFDRIELIESIFFRSNLVYLIGRICRLPDESLHSPELPRKTQSGKAELIPLVLCLVNTENGILIDAVLLDEDEVSIIFSFTRSYFHVEVQRPHELVVFLKSIMPLKRIAELYISIGYNKHGKTELYRDLLRHLASSTDKFEIARGERGMVMQVFTMRSFDLVFKVIKDKVDPPKSTSRQEVMERYDLVFKHDRAGRLVDAQEFEHLRFDRDRFSEKLLTELVAYAPGIVRVEQECVVIKHLYMERRLTPLNLYIKEAGYSAAERAVLDYGRAIKDLAATNIFPGDILLKNFGVTRHGRVVFYDYDELCLLTDCKFRRMPQPTNLYDELEAEAWFYVGPMDIFPEEFRTFLGLQDSLRKVFIDHHADLFGVGFWRQMQAKHHAGEVVDIYPYPDSKHLSQNPH